MPLKDFDREDVENLENTEKQTKWQKAKSFFYKVCPFKKRLE